MKFDAGAKLERIGQTVVGYAPALGKMGLNATAGLGPDQSVINIRDQDEVGEIRRLGGLDLADGSFFKAENLVAGGEREVCLQDNERYRKR